MRFNRITKLLNFQRFQRLKKDFRNPWTALLACSGVSSDVFGLETHSGEIIKVNRDDLLIWDEYFSGLVCDIKIEKGMFHIFPNNPQHPDYYIKGCSSAMTYKPARWCKENVPALLRELEDSEWSEYSQHGEDGIVSALLEKIGINHKFIVEFGAHDGINMSNSRYWIEKKDWKAFLIEADPTFYSKLQKLYKGSETVKYKKCFVTPENINQLFREHDVPWDFDVLSIDVDGPDYYIWDGLTEFEPSIVIVEYNSSKLPDDEYVVPKDKIFELGATSDEGGSLLAFYRLGERKGYLPVYSELFGSNLFFVHKRYASVLDTNGISPETLYQPPQFGELAGTRALSGRGYK